MGLGGAGRVHGVADGACVGSTPLQGGSPLAVPTWQVAPGRGCTGLSRRPISSAQAAPYDERLPSWQPTHVGSFSSMHRRHSLCVCRGASRTPHSSAPAPHNMASGALANASIRRQKWTGVTSIEVTPQEQEPVLVPSQVPHHTAHKLPLAPMPSHIAQFINLWWRGPSLQLSSSKPPPNNNRSAWRQDLRHPLQHLQPAYVAQHPAPNYSGTDQFRVAGDRRFACQLHRKGRRFTRR